MFRSSVLIASCLVAAMAIAEPAGKPSATVIQFGGVDYLHRWSKNGQNEYTPKSDPDLKKWRDMITINVFDNVKNGDQLADVANRIVDNYQAAGKIIRTDAKPRTKDAPAEYLIVASLGDPAFLEGVFARLVLRNGVGYAIVRSHRVYGQNAGPAMSTWLQANGPATEDLLMKWDRLPPREGLKALPQSR
jgi:hypothetical protein